MVSQLITLLSNMVSLKALFLVPYYFSSMILREILNLKCIFFADDSMFFSIVNDPVISANELNRDLKVINQWAYQWKMEYNPDPNKQATEFSCKKNSPNHPSLFFNEQKQNYLLRETYMKTS